MPGRTGVAKQQFRRIKNPTSTAIQSRNHLDGMRALTICMRCCSQGHTTPWKAKQAAYYAGPQQRLIRKLRLVLVGERIERSNRQTGRAFACPGSTIFKGRKTLVIRMAWSPANKL